MFHPNQGPVFFFRFHFSFEVPKDLPKDYSIGVIVGASGTGKSTLLKEFGKAAPIIWETNKAIASHFDSPEDAVERLSAAGLDLSEMKSEHALFSSAPTWEADILKNPALVTGNPGCHS